MQTFEGIGLDEQLDVWEAVAKDPRPRVETGFDPLDSLLHRGSFGPGNLVVLGGRLHTRKTAVAMNLVANMLKRKVPVGFIGLDEAPHMYVAKLASVLTGISHSELEISLSQGELPKKAAELYHEHAKHLSITRGYRPTFDQMSGWLETASVTIGQRPRVVFIDYLSLLARAKYTKGDTERIARLIEDLQVWTNDQEVVTVVLHQVGRTDDTSKKNHGDSPVTPENLMYGGEQQADIILSTYRPTLNPIGNMSQRQAAAEGVDEDDWDEARRMVEEFHDITMLQLTKNRPGTHLLFRGFPLRSQGYSQRMTPVEDELNADGQLLTEDVA